MVTDGTRSASFKRLKAKSATQALAANTWRHHDRRAWCHLPTSSRDEVLRDENEGTISVAVAFEDAAMAGRRSKY